MDDASSEFVTREDKAVYETDEPVLYSVDNGIATVTMNRPTFNNVQNSQMTYALDAALRKATDDDSVKVIVLRGEGRHFSAGHDIGTPGRDINKSFDRAPVVGSHQQARRRAAVCPRAGGVPGHVPPLARHPQAHDCHGAGRCVAGLMLAWVCDLIVASDDFSGSRGAHGHSRCGVLRPRSRAASARIAKEFLLLGERMPAERLSDGHGQPRGAACRA
jgi:enoyl-CoA hydratase